MNPTDMLAAEAGDTAEYLDFEQLVAKFYEAEPRVRVRVEVGARSHPGKVRPSNEDQYLAVRRYRGRELIRTSLPVELLEAREDHTYTFAVADGMGGRHFGEIASLLALMTGWELGAGEVKWTVKVNEREEGELRQKADVLFQLINRALLNAAAENPRLTGMGTTLTIAYSTGPELFVMHAGDSRAYLHRRGHLRQLTHDHTVAQLMIDCGVATPDSPEAKRKRHVLTNYLGGAETPVQVQVLRQRLAPGDLLLLCTDGLNDQVDDAEIAAVLDRPVSPDEACQALLDLALERGGRDNVTVLLARYAFEEPPSEPPAEARTAEIETIPGGESPGASAGK